jgi:hypothetical protein
VSDIYRDTDERYLRDPAFHSAVRTMEAIAREHGFTPGELKQIAFKAALNLEERRDGQRYAVRCPDVRGHDMGGGSFCVYCGFSLPVSLRMKGTSP